MSFHAYARVACTMLLGASLLQSASLAARELEEGFVLNKDNIEGLLDDTFEGHPIRELVPENVRTWWMNDAALEMRLSHSRPAAPPPAYVEATERYRGTAQYDPATRTVTGYQAGIPFPDVDMDDPDAGMKLLWNWELAGWNYQDVFEVDAPVYVVSMDKGLERSMLAQGITVKMQGRTSIPPMTVEPGVVKRQVLVFTEPYDVAGIGTMFTRYTDPKRMDDAWVYIKSLRRVRRITGGTWMDPIANLDQLYDDYFALDSNPAWYHGAKLLGKQHLLWVIHGLDPDEPHDVNERARLTGTPPFCSPINQPWEPREVYKIEIVLPPEHPYSRKIVYMDAEAPLVYLAEAWDRKGDFWKIVYMLFARQEEMLDGQPGGVQISGNGGIDFQRRHCNYVDVRLFRNNNPNIKPNDVTQDLLRQGGTGGAILKR